MKVSELEGIELDCWVAEAEGWQDIGKHVNCENCSNNICIESHTEFTTHGLPPDDPQRQPIPEYSTNWHDGGPLIEKYDIDLIVAADKDKPNRVEAEIFGEDEIYTQYGDTALIAVCRCVVASKFGDEVKDIK